MCEILRERKHVHPNILVPIFLGTVLRLGVVEVHAAEVVQPNLCIKNFHWGWMEVSTREDRKNRVDVRVALGKAEFCQLGGWNRAAIGLTSSLLSS